jgi:hypothetical protein
MTYDEYLAWADEHMHVEWKDGEALSALLEMAAENPTLMEAFRRLPGQSFVR